MVLRTDLQMKVSLTMGAALLSKTLMEILILMDTVVGITFTLIQCFLVSCVKVAPDHSHASNNNNKNGYTEYLIEEEEGVNDHNVVTKCAEIQNAISEDLAPTSVRELLVPGIQNLLKDPDSLDPAHKEALEIIVRERSGGTLEALTKVMESHLSMTTVNTIFGETGLLGKKDTGDISDAAGLMTVAYSIM